MSELFRFPTDDYRIDLPLGHPRARHPQDAVFPDAEVVWDKSSAQKHMMLTRRATPSQQGAHFDNPFHFDERGSRETTGPTGGWARVIDFRDFLTRLSDGHAITEGVVRGWLQSMGSGFSRNDLSWGIVGIRTLKDEDLAQNGPLQHFPYWENPAAVRAFLEGIFQATDVQVHAVLNEPASVDRVDEGYLLDPNPDTGRGGAHGAFDRRHVAIGEFFDFSRVQKLGGKGMFNAVRAPTFPDSTPLAAAWFIPEEHYLRRT